MPDYLSIGLVLAAGGLIQSAAGFGFGIFAIPALVLVGLRPEVAIPLVSIGSMAQLLVAVWRQRRDMPWKVILSWAPLAVLTLPVGVWLLTELTTHQAPLRVRQVFGGLALVAVLAQMCLRPAPRPRLHPAWTATAMIFTGLFGGLAGMPGVPLVLWVMAHDWSSAHCRRVLWGMFVVLTPVMLLIYLLLTPAVATGGIVQGFVFLPAVLVGMAPGFWLGHRLSEIVLRRVAFAILIGLGLYALFQPLLAGSQR